MKPHRFLFLLILLLILIGCGETAGLGSEPTNEPPPTPTAVQSVTNTPKPMVSPTEIPEIKQGIWEGRVFYEIFVRSFYDSDGDGVGDLRGVIEKLDYLEELGVSGIWLMPIAESPSYHGYDVVDYYRVDREYGTKADFEALMTAAHERDIVVIVDLVLNHSSAQHPWFRQAVNADSPFREWYVWEDDNPNRQGWHMVNGDYYYGYFWDQMPDLNYEYPPVTEAMRAVSRYWLEEMGVDGFRLDAIKHLIEDGEQIENTAETRAWFTEYQAFLKEINRDSMTVGEVWSSTETAAKYVKEEGVDLVFEFNSAEAILAAARGGSALSVHIAFNESLRQYPNQQFATFITNHDQSRVASQLFKDPERAKIAATILLTGPGVPFIYYGEEIGMLGVKPDEYIRTPMQWSDAKNSGFTTGKPWIEVNEDYETVNVEAQLADEGSVLNHYRRLIEIREQYLTADAGYVDLDTSERKVYASAMQTGEGILVTVVNLSRSAMMDVEIADLDDLGETISLLGSLPDSVAGYDELAPLTSHVFWLPTK